MGGEKYTFERVVMHRGGSPPRRRGKAESRTQLQCGYRITPALAGKSREIPLHLRAAKDHPRMGGEKITRIAPKNWGSGSPPRRRGKASVWHYR